MINNVVSDKYGSLNHFVKNKIWNGKENDEKIFDKLRV